MYKINKYKISKIINFRFWFTILILCNIQFLYPSSTVSIHEGPNFYGRPAKRLKSDNEMVINIRSISNNIDINSNNQLDFVYYIKPICAYLKRKALLVTNNNSLENFVLNLFLNNTFPCIFTDSDADSKEIAKQDKELARLMDFHKLKINDSEFIGHLCKISGIQNVVSLEYSNNNNLLSYSNDDGVIRLWDRETKKSSIMIGHIDDITCVKCLGHIVVSGDSGGLVILWDTLSLAVTVCFGHKAAINDITINKDFSFRTTDANAIARDWKITDNVYRVHPKFFENLKEKENFNVDWRKIYIPTTKEFGQIRFARHWINNDELYSFVEIDSDDELDLEENIDPKQPWTKADDERCKIDSAIINLKYITDKILKSNKAVDLLHNIQESHLQKVLNNSLYLKWSKEVIDIINKENLKSVMVGTDLIDLACYEKYFKSLS